MVKPVTNVHALMVASVLLSDIIMVRMENKACNLEGDFSSELCIVHPLSLLFRVKLRCRVEALRG